MSETTGGAVAAQRPARTASEIAAAMRAAAGAAEARGRNVEAHPDAIRNLAALVERAGMVRDPALVAAVRASWGGAPAPSAALAAGEMAQQPGDLCLCGHTRGFHTRTGCHFALAADCCPCLRFAAPPPAPEPERETPGDESWLAWLREAIATASRIIAGLEPDWFIPEPYARLKAVQDVLQPLVLAAPPAAPPLSEQDAEDERLWLAGVLREFCEIEGFAANGEHIVACADSAVRLRSRGEGERP